MYLLTKIYPFQKLGRNIYFHGSRDKKRIALTFDDGPSNQTENILKVLRKYNARGTFFIIGKKIAANRRTLRDIVKQGSEIGNHSYNHQPLIFKSRKLIKLQIEKTDKELRKLKIKTNLFRPPYGSFGYNLLSVVRELDKRVILWDVDPRDWSNPGIKTAANYIINRARNGSIVDLHDYAEGIGKNNNLSDILDKTIPILKDKGYEFSTISDILKLQS